MNPKPKTRKLKGNEKKLFDGPQQEGQTKNKATIRELFPGNYFGEVSLIYNCDHSATVKAMNYGTLGRLNKKQCEEMFMLWPEYRQAMEHSIISYYNDDFRCFII